MNRKHYGFSEVDLSVPTLEKELRRVDNRINFERKLTSTFFIIVVLIAVAVIISVTLFPVLRIFGSSMEPTLKEGDIVISQKTGKVSPGDLIAFYYGNKVLIKRCIAVGGDTVTLNEDGEVFVNGKKLSESYVKNVSKGELDIDLPYLVPSDRIFVMGDDRENSIDSRNAQIGCVAGEQIIGKIKVKVWPLNNFRIF